MSDQSRIEWIDATWNPVTGCRKTSPGCDHCYAERLARRLQAMGNPRYVNGFSVTLHWDKLDEPLRWRAPRRIFVNSMSDLFHADVPLDFVKSVFETMVRAHWHTFQILTKRARRLPRIAPALPWPSNVWLGASVENAAYTWRIDCLRESPAAVRFLSLETLIGAVGELDLTGIHWVIVGGESGPAARPMSASWVREIRTQCQRADVAFFFKQWGGVNKKAAGRVLDGRTWDDLPASARTDASPARPALLVSVR
ncbi:MAG: phage Gp37/Gp68 family protein [Actinobacteria bacterium]|nr:phage Gp37/Gp68 family protein [Actinomycetota bacterium]